MATYEMLMVQQRQSSKKYQSSVAVRGSHAGWAQSRGPPPIWASQGQWPTSAPSLQICLNIFPQATAPLHCKRLLQYLNNSFCFVFPSCKDRRSNNHSSHKHWPAGEDAVFKRVGKERKDYPHPEKPWEFPAVQPESYSDEVAGAPMIVVVPGHSLLWSETCPLGTQLMLFSMKN